MALSIRKLHPHFFGEVSGVDLRQPLTPQEAADIEAGMDEYAVLLFRDQERAKRTFLHAFRHGP